MIAKLKRTALEQRELDRLIRWGVEQGYKTSAIADEAGISATYCTNRIKALGYQSVMISPSEQELIREARKQRDAA